jgi:hypothetical protein
MPTVNIQASAYDGSYGSGAWNSGTAPGNIQLPHDDNTTRMYSAAPNRGAIHSALLNNPTAAAAVTAGTLYSRSWRSSSYGGSNNYYLFRGTTQLTTKNDGGPTSWTTTSKSYTCAPGDLATLKFRHLNANVNPTDVRVTTTYYSMTYTPAGGGGYRWLLAGFLMGALWVPNLLGQIGGGLGLEHMPAIQAALPGATHQGRFLNDNELGDALEDLRAWTRPTYVEVP